MQYKEPNFFKLFFIFLPFPFGELEQIVDNFLGWDGQKMAEIFVNLPNKSPFCPVAGRKTWGRTKNQKRKSIC